VCNEHSSIVHPSRIDSRLGLDHLQDLVRLGDKLNVCVVWTKAPEEAGRMPGCSWGLEKAAAVNKWALRNAQHEDEVFLRLAASLGPHFMAALYF
jgi:hypothetical protein